MIAPTFASERPESIFLRYSSPCAALALEAKRGLAVFAGRFIGLNLQPIGSPDNPNHSLSFALRALRIGNQAAKQGTRAQTADCSDCCQPPTGETWYQACPCLAYETRPCALPDEPCIYIDTRSSLSDGLTGEALAVALQRTTAVDPITNQPIDPPVIIRVNGICYRLLPYLFAQEADPNDARISALPPGASLYGGPESTVERRTDCEEGCAEVNVGPEYAEIFPCDGCPVDENRRFVCLREVEGWSVVVVNGGAWCIDRSTGYTQAQAETLGLIVDPAITFYIWDIGPVGPVRVPAPSCCFFNGPGNCRDVTCLQGTDWHYFGADNRMFPLDVCCGTREGFRYDVDFLYVRQTVGGPPDDRTTTTVTYSVASLSPRAGGGTDVVLASTIRVERPAQGIDTTTEGETTVSLEPFCCLPYSGLVPMTTVLDQDISTNDPVPDAPGFFYSTRRPHTTGDDAEQRRIGWLNSAFGFALLTQRDETGVYQSTGGVFGSCRVWSFLHDEMFTYPNGDTESTHINLVVRTMNDNSPPCDYLGPCGAGGWGGEVGGALP